ncbi:MAG TPA: four helix bundle protein [Candidatus Peribacteria bacterium]|nr:four helix bundle protein [Candidatus Peribacteria bacterium]
MHQRPYEKLIVWQEAYKLCLFVYRVTSEFPSYEKFGLANQARRSAVSVPLNIAEGNAKHSKPDQARFLDIAIGSLEELHCSLRISRDLEYMDNGQFERIDHSVQRTSFLLMRLRKTCK